MIKNLFYKAGLLLIILSIALPYAVFAQEGDLPEPETPSVVEEAQDVAPFSPSDDLFTFTILHINDFHGNLEPSIPSSYPGMARVANYINSVTASVGITKTLLLDAGDEMQGTFLSNINKGVPVIDVFNMMGFKAAAPGNHEFDWGQPVLISRTLQATYPFLAANMVVKDTADCATAGWTSPSFVKPWITTTVGVPGNQVVVGIIGVTTQETPFITIASATAGLCFKDPTASITRYYDAVKAAGAQVMVVLSHDGYEDGGYGYGFSVTGDKTLAKNLINASKPVDLIIGGHSHTNPGGTGIDMTKPITVTVSGPKTWVVQAHSAGRKVGKADITVNRTTGQVSMVWSYKTIGMSDPQDPAILAKIATYTSDPAYQARKNAMIGFTNVPLELNPFGDSLMAELVNDSVYNDLNNDLQPLNDVDMFFQNAGGIRVSITSTVGYPYTLTYGSLFDVLPFGNATIVGNMTGAQIVDLLNYAPQVSNGVIQPAGLKYKYYAYRDANPGPQPWAWGAYDAQVWNKSTHAWEPLDLAKTYKVGTNEFLAPAGQDGYVPFKYFTNGTYWGDMLNQVNHWISMTHGTRATAWNGPGGTGVIDTRIWRNGGDAYNGLPTEVIPITILHHNDPHGNMAKGTFVGYTQLASLIKQERLHNAARTLLLNAGDSIQGDAMMYYFRTAALGYASDGTPLPAALQMNPLIKAYNLMGYDAMTLGNHEFNFGHQVFTSTLQQANFPMLQANLTDSGAYGLDEVPVEPYVLKNLGGIKVAILGIGNHRVPNYELPSNIPGLTFTNPISTAVSLVPTLKASNDVVIALTHIGFTTNPKSVEVDNNVDTVLAAQVPDIDAIIGGHSHTDPTKQTDASGVYKFLPAIVDGPANTPVIINQAYRYNNYLGEVVLGLLPKTGMASGVSPESTEWAGYDVVTRVGRNIAVSLSTTPEDAQIKAVVDAYTTLLTNYTSKILGKTTVPIDARTAFTQETNGANLQADASVAELKSHGITPDFHLSGAMTNQWVASTATITNPYTLTVSNMFTLMPYENSLVMLRMNGPQLKAVLERGYRNYYYYKYVPGYGGYSYYTTCMIDTNKSNQIRYNDTYPLLPNGNNVTGLVINGTKVDFTNASKYYNVSTVNYLAAGSCNFNDGGVSLWPLSQIVADTQYYVRDAVINYIKATGTVSPTIEGRLLFAPLTLKDYFPLLVH